MSKTNLSPKLPATNAATGGTAGAAGAQSRRAFLKNAAAALAAGAFLPAFPAFVPASALGRDGSEAPSNRIQLGVIGTAQGGADLDGFLGFGDVQAVAVCDVDANRRNGRLASLNRAHGGRHKGAKGYNDFREMFAKAGLDAVIIAPPDHWHGIMGVAAARAGIDIYGEKPLAHTLVEGRAIVEAVRQHGRVWQTGSWQRSVSNFHRAVELVRNGRIGKLVKIVAGTHGGFGRPGPKPADYGKPPAHLDYDLWVGPAQFTPYDSRALHWNWRWILNTGGGNLMDWVGHHVDIAQWGANKDKTGPVKVEPKHVKFSTSAPWDAETEYEYECTYADGLVLTVNHGSGTKFIGEDGKWVKVNRGHLSASDPAILREVIGVEEEHIYHSTNHARNFVDCIKTRRETITPAETAHRSASIGHLGHIALTLGRTIRWNPETETIAGDPTATAMLSPSFRGNWSL
ncbi:MAG: Gfo/Idh/MocA family oxidoreductase [Puniceicoccales bacterium]|jgi:predicted dehydrogenase|nr:Gfo/Idh/MocA family oxidoreductase [Puniceicoccales bacterium]